MPKKYIILASFISSVAFSHNPGEEQNPPVEGQKPPAEFKSLFKREKIIPHRKSHAELSGGVRKEGLLLKVRKKSHATALDLRLSDTGDYDSSDQAYLAIMNKLPKDLNRLSLSIDDISGDTLPRCSVKALRRLRRLKELDVRKSGWVHPIFKNEAAFQELGYLKLNKLKLRSKLKEPFVLVKRRITLSKSIKYLECAGIEFSSLKALKKTLSPLCSLTSLSLANIGTNLPELERWSINNDNLSSLARILNRFNHLENLEIIYPEYDLSSESVVRLLQLGPNLKSLSLGNFKGEFNLAPLASYLAKGTSLTHLSLTSDSFILPPLDKEEALETLLSELDLNFDSDSFAPKGSLETLLSKLESLSLAFVWPPHPYAPQPFLRLFADLPPLKYSTVKTLRFIEIGDPLPSPETEESYSPDLVEMIGLLNILGLPTLEDLVLDEGYLSVFSKLFCGRNLSAEQLNARCHFKSLECRFDSRIRLKFFLDSIFKKGEIQTLSLNPKHQTSYSNDVMFENMEGGYIPQCQSDDSLIECILENPHLKTLKLEWGTIDSRDIPRLFSKENLEKIYLSSIDVFNIDPQKESKKLEEFISSLARAIDDNPKLDYVYIQRQDRVLGHPKTKEILLQAQERRPALKVIFD